MLLEIREVIARTLYREGGIDPGEVDIKFEPPAAAWVNSLLRPTINFFLFDLQENTDLRRTGMETSRSGNAAIRRMPPRRFDLRYMVTVLTTEVEDEHVLLWRTLAALLRYPEFPQEILPDGLQGVDATVSARVVRPDEGPRFAEYWHAFGVHPRPALLYVLTVPVDLEIEVRLPLVLTRTSRYTALDGTGGANHAHQIGGQVVYSDGRPASGVVVVPEGSGGEGSITNSAGEFVLSHMTPGAHALRVLLDGSEIKRVNLSVPSNSYDIILD